MKLTLVLLIFATTVLAFPQRQADIHNLFTQLNQPKNTDLAARQILALASMDSDARQYVKDRLPAMIDKPDSDEVWMNAVKLAGQLKVVEAVPSLVKALPRGPMGGPLNTSFATQMRLNDDIVAKSLSQIGDPVIPAVTDFLNHGSDQSRRRAVLILTNIASPTARKVLQDRLPSESNPRIKQLIEDALRS
jgi:HEAT repeat protein